MCFLGSVTKLILNKYFRNASQCLGVFNRRPPVQQRLTCAFIVEKETITQCQQAMASQNSKTGPGTFHGAAAPATETASQSDQTNDTPPKIDDPEPKTSKSKTILLMVSVFLSIFLVGLDRTIISTVRTINYQFTQVRLPYG